MITPMEAKSEVGTITTAMSVSHPEIRSIMMKMPMTITSWLTSCVRFLLMAPSTMSTSLVMMERISPLVRVS